MISVSHENQCFEQSIAKYALLRNVVVAYSVLFVSVSDGSATTTMFEALSDARRRARLVDDPFWMSSN